MLEIVFSESAAGALSFAMLDGRTSGGVLASVPETLYDICILQEIEKAETEFPQAQVIGSVILNYPFGLSDTWIALRMEQFIKDGLLEPVTAAKREDPMYHRILRKCGGLHKTAQSV